MMQIAKYFHLHLLGCDLQQVLPPDIFIANKATSHQKKYLFCGMAKTPNCSYVQNISLGACGCRHKKT
ncbi:hypothetical protein, partial [Citrobacter freundii]|uniref:hypothetical protein n=1 Tax=Citrobacter freundii TaxID=546 RepID=UPI0034D67A67